MLLYPCFVSVLEIQGCKNPVPAARNLEKNMNIPYKGPVDGLANENEPLAYPSDKNIRFCSVGTPTVIVSTPINDVSSLIFEGMELRAENHSVHDRKLQIALDLFAAYW